MMNKKFLTMMFSLLLAVGWTSDATAQVKAPESMPLQLSKKMVEKTPRQATNGHRANAPRRADVTEDVPHVASWYAGFKYTWTDDAGTHESNITEPATKPEQMRALAAYIYETKEIPGSQYSEPMGANIPYEGVDFGYYISSDVTEDIVISMTPYVRISSITITDANDDPITSLTPGQTKSGWTVSNSVSRNGTSYWYIDPYYYSSRVTAFTISKNLLAGKGAVKVKVNARSTEEHTPYGYYQDGTPAYSSTTHYTYWVNYEQYAHGQELTTSWADYTTPINGPINAPDDNGYTVLLVKLSNEVDYLNTQAPKYTKSKDELINYFETYVTELQLLTDGLRVGSGNTAGTVFSYTGDLNKGKHLPFPQRAHIGGSENSSTWYADNTNNVYYYDYNADCAPFYNMYEEFSPTTQDNTTGIDDFYEKMKQGATYDVIHDCQSVNYMEHFFSMSGTEGTTENRVNSLVLYIPDDRGKTNPEDDGTWRDYDHKPTVGMYMIDLYANVAPSDTAPDYYTVTVNWYDNLDEITHTENIPQTYKLYEIRDKDGDGDMDTTLVYTGPNISWSKDYPIGDPSYYDISYYVVGTPTAATNQDTFFAKSNTDDVTIPGKRDILGLQWERYESDYVIQSEAEQVNYYRNWLAPRALSVQGDAGYTAGNVGAAGRTLTLYRNDGKSETPIMYLDLIMDGNKAYYRIRYINREANQQVEDGYDPQTGELTTNNNNN